MSTITIHWKSRFCADKECFSPSWRIDVRPPLEVVLPGESEDVVRATFWKAYDVLSGLSKTLHLSDSDKLLYSEESLKNPEVAADFAEIQALKLAVECYPVVYTTDAPDTAPDESQFEPSKGFGVINTPEVTDTHIGYRLRSMSGTCWWRTPLTKQRRAEKELSAVLFLHPLLSWSLKNWDGYESALSTFNSHGLLEEKAYIHTEMERCASEAIKVFNERFRGSPVSRESGLQLEYKRSVPISQASGNTEVDPSHDAEAHWSRADPTVAALASQAPCGPLSRTSSTLQQRARSPFDSAASRAEVPAGHVFPGKSAVLVRHSSNELDQAVVHIRAA